MRTTIKSRPSSNISRLGPQVSELHTLERWKKFPQTYKSWRHRFSVSNFSQPFLIWVSSNFQVMSTDIKSCSSSNSFWIGQDTHDLGTLKGNSKTMSPTFSGHFYQIFFILAGNDDNHKVSTEFEFQQNRTKGLRVTCLWALKEIPTDL